MTSIESLDGGFDFINALVSKTIKPGANPVVEIVKDMPNTELGKITEPKKLTRSKVLIGNASDLIQDQINPDETWYIENGNLNLLKNGQVINNKITAVNASTGMISTPTRASKLVTFETLMNPSIGIGERIKLESVTAPHLDGIYKVQTIITVGDNYGESWNQTITCELFAKEVV